MFGTYFLIAAGVFERNNGDPRKRGIQNQVHASIKILSAFKVLMYLHVMYTVGLTNVPVDCCLQLAYSASCILENHHRPSGRVKSLLGLVFLLELLQLCTFPCWSRAYASQIHICGHHKTCPSNPG